MEKVDQTAAALKAAATANRSEFRLNPKRMVRG